MITIALTRETPDWFRCFEAGWGVQRQRAAIDNWVRRRLEPPQIKPLDAIKFPRREFYRHYHGKCAYCETRIGEGEARVDRFRPLDNARQYPDTGQVDAHHYCWLAWEWTNLRLACTACDERKRSFLPTLDGCRVEPGVTGMRLLDEPLLLLDPGSPFVNPLRHLVFDAHGGVTARAQRKKPSLQGEITIKLLDLNREPLREARAAQAGYVLDAWQKTLIAAQRNDGSSLDQMLERLEGLCADQAEFASMARQVLYQRRLALRQDDPLLNQVLTRRAPLRSFFGRLRHWNTFQASRPQPEPLDPLIIVSSSGDSLDDEDFTPVLATGIGSELRASKVADNAVTVPARADVLLVTVTDIERKAVLEQFKRKLGRGFVRQFHKDNTYYYLGSLQNVEIFLVQSGMGSGGPDGAALTINDSIDALQPAAVIMVGIAFGVDEQKQQIGDILVARQLFLYDLLKIGPGSTGDEIIPRDARPSASVALLDRFRSGHVDWRGPEVSFGLLLSGEKLVDQPSYREQLRRLAPEAIGGEMEGGGLYAAAHRQRVDWILVKAICDYADGHKSHTDKDKHQKIAARNAARFVVHVLGQGGMTSRPHC